MPEALSRFPLSLDNNSFFRYSANNLTGRLFGESEVLTMSVRIVIDSASDLTKEQADALGVLFLPCKTIFGDEEFSDGIDLSHREFYEKLIEGDCMPTTSQIPPHEYEAVFSRIKSAGDTAVVLTLSSRLSGSCQSAHIAREGYEDCIWIVDSENVCLGEQILVLYACSLLDEGKSAAEIADALERRKKNVRLIALLDTLEYLKRGGRISGAAALAGNLLSIKPVIAITDGEVAVLGKARGSKNGNNMLCEEIAKSGGVDFSMPFCLGYSGLDDTLLQKYIADSAALWEDHVSELPISTIGSTIGTHAGPGAIGVAFFSNSKA